MVKVRCADCANFTTRGVDHARRQMTKFGFGACALDFVPDQRLAHHLYGGPALRECPTFQAETNAAKHASRQAFVARVMERACPKS